MRFKLWTIHKWTRLHFPKKWDKTKLISFLNTNIKVCEICNKVDISIDHYEKKHLK